MGVKKAEPLHLLFEILCKQARFDDDWRSLRHLTWWRFKIGLLCLLQKQSRDVGWMRIQG